MPARIRMTAAFWVFGCLAFSSTVWSTVRVQEFRNRPYLHDNLYLPSGRFIDELALDYKQVVADVVWLSAIQYYGEYREGDHSLAYFRGLIDIVTTLDPHFVFAYVFGAMVVSEDIGNYDQGVEILRKGMSHNPTSWRLPFEVGFLGFVNHVDDESAGRYLNMSSRIPGAPERTRRLAAFVYAKSGQKASAIRLWQEYLEYTSDPLLKELAERYIEKLEHDKPLRGRPEDM